jgi:hypothetical protein
MAETIEAWMEPVDAEDSPNLLLLWFRKKPMAMKVAAMRRCNAAAPMTLRRN